MMGFPFHREWFLDSRAILAANDAARMGADPTQPNALDPFNRPHVYSELVAWAALAGADAH